MSKEYQKIPGIGTGKHSYQMFIRKKVYAAADHFLILETSGYSEEYKRVFYRDVQALLVRKNYGQIWVGIVMGILVLLLSLPIIVSHSNLVFVLICLLLPLGPAIYFIVNLILGPMCECYLQTSVQIIRVPVPQRMGKVKLFADFIRSKNPLLGQGSQGQPNA